MSNSSFKIKHGLNVSGNVVVTGNIDGRDLVIDGNKLDNIEVWRYSRSKCYRN